MLLEQMNVKNFRGFQDFTISRLGRFTLIAGSNDVGKTSLLEAIFMLSGMMRMDISARINTFRNVSVIKEDDLYSMFYAQEIDREVSIIGTFDNGIVRTLKLKSFTPKTMQYSPAVDITATALNGSLKTSFKQKFSVLEYGKQKKAGELIFLADSSGVLKEFTRVKESEDWHCIFLPAKNYFNGFANLKTAILNKEDSYILQMLQNIDPTIRKLTLVGEQVFVDTGLSHLLPIQMLGDGLIKIIHACAAVLMCKGGGLVCLDEIDNGLHFSAMQEFWLGITQCAAKHDVQIIATTHDYDLLNAVARVTDFGFQRDFEYLKLVRQKRDGRESVFAYPYNFEQYSSAVEAGTEMR